MFPSTAATPQQPATWLVDTNFRGKFVENQKRTASHTNLSSLGRSKSTVRFLDELPERPKKENEPAGATLNAALRQSGVPSTGKPNISAQEEEEANSSQDDDGYDANESDDNVPLPRTKSQLSVMIAHERRKSESYELGNSSMQLDQRPPKAGPESCKKDEREGEEGEEEEEEEEEDELVMMGRRDGVTKAGGVSSVAKGKQRMSPRGGEDLRYQSPPTPPLY